MQGIDEPYKNQLVYLKPLVTKTGKKAAKHQSYEV